MAAKLEPIDNRMDRRYASTFQLKYSFFSSTQGSLFEATAFNCSDGGLCFQSAFPLKQWQYICVRSGPVDSELSPTTREAVPVKSLALAQVRWCRSDPDTAMPRYTIGIKYI